nr:hypothetical protein [Tanacetum cinerariifolium]
MSRANPQATIVSEEQLVPRANRLVIKKNNQRVTSDSDITDTMLRFSVEILRHHKLYKLVSLTATIPIIYLHQFWTTINHNPNNHTFTFELDTHTFTLIPGLLRNKIVDELEEQRVSPVKSGRGKGFVCYSDQVVNVPNKLKKDVVPRKTRSLTIVKEIVVGDLENSISIQELRTKRRRRSQLIIDSQIDDAVVDTYAEWGQKLKGPVVEDFTVQSLLDLLKGSKASKLKSLK